MGLLLAFVIAVIIFYLCISVGLSVEYLVASVFSKQQKPCNDWRVGVFVRTWWNRYTQQT